MGIRSYYRLSDPEWRRTLRWFVASLLLSGAVIIALFWYVANTFALAIMWAAAIPA